MTGERLRLAGPIRSWRLADDHELMGQTFADPGDLQCHSIEPAQQPRGPPGMQMPHLDMARDPGSLEIADVHLHQSRALKDLVELVGTIREEMPIRIGRELQVL